MSKNYNWSEDEDEYEDKNELATQPDRLFPPNEYESEEEYENYNKLINEKLSSCNIDDKYNIEKNNKIIKEKTIEKKIDKINLWKELQKPEEEKKKWKSKRMHQKRHDDGKIEVKTRQFNPRLPIPNKKFKNNLNNIKKKLNFNENEFPNINI